MTNSHFSSAAFLAVVLCGAPLLAQQATDTAAPATPPDSAVSAPATSPDSSVPAVTSPAAAPDAAATAPAAPPESSASAPAAPPDSAASANPQAATASPGVRIVRLSQVIGEGVQLDRQTGRGFEAAFANLPITQGGVLRTGNGVAEVEFEDNSSLRLTPQSIVAFPVLSLGPDGTRSSTVHVLKGAVYASLTKSKQNNVSLTFGHETLVLGPGSHVDLDLNGTQPRLDVMDGTVQAVNGATTTTVGRKKALLFDPASSAAPTLVSKNEKGQYDDWDKHAVEYHERLAPSGGNYAGTPYAYGLADMNYYGNFAQIGGCGMMWRPYLVSSSWSPYDNGVWAWYPNAGYSWVSPYPWGWTAFHSGSWNYCPGSGWGWQPGNQWNGLQNTALVQRPNIPNTLKPPIARPHPAGSTMIPVNQKPLVVSTLNDKDAFTFRRDSAGLGVPRSTFGKLDHISNDVVHHGMVEKPAFVASSFNGSNGRPEGNQAPNSAYRGAMATHTMPANGRGSMSTHTSPSAGSSSMGGRQSVSGGSLGGGSRSSMGGSMGSASAGGHASGTGHH